MKRYNIFRRLTYAVSFCVVSLVAISLYVYCIYAIARFVANYNDGPKSLTTEKTQTLDTIRPEPRNSKPVNHAPVTGAYADTARLIAMSNQNPTKSTGVLKGGFVK